MVGGEIIEQPITLQDGQAQSVGQLDDVAVCAGTGDLAPNQQYRVLGGQQGCRDLLHSGGGGVQGGRRQESGGGQDGGPAGAGQHLRGQGQRHRTLGRGQGDAQRAAHKLGHAGHLIDAPPPAREGGRRAEKVIPVFERIPPALQDGLFTLGGGNQRRAILPRVVEIVQRVGESHPAAQREGGAAGGQGIAMRRGDHLALLCELDHAHARSVQQRIEDRRCARAIAAEDQRDAGRLELLNQQPPTRAFDHGGRPRPFPARPERRRRSAGPAIRAGRRRRRWLRPRRERPPSEATPGQTAAHDIAQT
jgi:hypothetical protein